MKVFVYFQSYEEESRPENKTIEITIEAELEVNASLRLRLPWWILGEAKCVINGEEVIFQKDEKGFANIKRLWKKDVMTIVLPKGLTCHPLADRKDTVAFLDGPVAKYISNNKSTNRFYI